MEEFRREALRAGRNAGPALLFDWWYGDKLTVEELRVLAPEV
jgi:homospermidine synthase